MSCDSSSSFIELLMSQQSLCRADTVHSADVKLLVAEVRLGRLGTMRSPHSHVCACCAGEHRL